MLFYKVQRGGSKFLVKVEEGCMWDKYESLENEG